MKQGDKLEHYAKKAFDNDEATVNTLKLWDKLNARPEMAVLNQKRKRRRFLFFFLFATIIGLGGIGYQLSPDNEPTKLAETITSNKKVEKETKDLLISSNTIEQKDIIAINEENNVFNKKLNTTKEEANPIVTTETGGSHFVRTKALKRPLINNFSTKAVASFDPNMANDVVVFENSTIDEQENKIDHSILKDKRVVNQNISFLPNPFAELIYLSKIKDIRPFEPVRKTKYRHRKISLFTELSISPYATFRSLEARNASAELYQNNRKETESALETMAISWQFGWRLEPKRQKLGYTFQTGINFVQITERFDFQNNLESTIETQSVLVEIIIDEYGEQTERYEVMPVETTFTREVEHFNTHRLINIPFLAGLTYQFHPKWTFVVNTGIHLNLQYQKEGRFLSPSDTPIYFDDNAEIDGQSIFRDRVGLSLSAGAGLLYQLSKQWNILLAPDFHYYPTSFTSSSYALKQNYSMLGLKCGIRFNLH